MPCVRAVLVPNPGLAGLRQGPCPLIPAKLRCFAVTVSHPGTAAGARWRPAGPCGVAAAPYRLLVGRNATVFLGAASGAREIHLAARCCQGPKPWQRG